MTPFDVYCCYLAFKNHFSKPNYDFFKYHGKSKASVNTFNKRKDKYFFEKISRQKSEEQIRQYFLANFIECSDSSKLWIGEIISTGEENHTKWQKRIQSLKYIFTNEISNLFDDCHFDSVFETKGQHPIVLKEYLSGRISLETFIILNQILKFSKNYDRILNDPIWESCSLKIKKYTPFLNLDIDNYKKLLKEKILND
jgi:hypothetical protein